MKQIIGNQEQRTSKVDTEKWKEHAEYYTNPENIKKIKGKWAEDFSKLESTLQYDSLGRPKLTLIPLEKTAVITPNETIYDVLMMVFESGGWKYLGTAPTDVIQRVDNDTCVTAGMDRFLSNIKGQFISGTHDTMVHFGHQIISTYGFYEAQRISIKTLQELQKWYDINKPNRTSRPR